jgi:hypothetical protein
MTCGKPIPGRKHALLLLSVNLVRKEYYLFSSIAYNIMTRINQQKNLSDIIEATLPHFGEIKRDEFMTGRPEERRQACRLKGLSLRGGQILLGLGCIAVHGVHGLPLAPDHMGPCAAQAHMVACKQNAVENAGRMWL